MTDILRILPSFPTRTFVSLLPALERHDVSTADLLSLDAAEIQRRTQLGLVDIRRLCAAVTAALHADIEPTLTALGGTSDDDDKDGNKDDDDEEEKREGGGSSSVEHAPPPLPPPTNFISTLDPTLDAALAGGFPAGYVSEVTGESGAAKTQLLLTLLLAVQLPPPLGLGRPALYISTETPLATTRLAQLLATHPVLAEHRKKCRLQRVMGDDGNESGVMMMEVALDNIVSASTPDLESQDHILTYQVPVEVARRNIGLVVLDSVAANYRAEYDTATRPLVPGSKSTGNNNTPPGRGSMATRGNDLARLGAQLHDLATRHNLAVVVANQVADRFPSAASMTMMPTHRSQGMAFVLRSTTPSSTPMAMIPTLGLTQESPLASRSRPPPANLVPFSSDPSTTQTPTTYHHQNNFFNSGAPDEDAPTLPALLLDHQQRWFTGWGDDPLPILSSSDDNDTAPEEKLKTPSLGLVWSTQLACRVALVKRPAYESVRRTRMRVDGDGDRDTGDRPSPGSGVVTTTTTTTTTGSWRRWLKVVFAPHVPAAASGAEVEFEVTGAGLRGVGGAE